MSRSSSRPWVVLVLTLALLGLSAVVAEADPRGDPPPYRVRLLAYNIHHGVGADGALDLERVARVIQDSGADVVALQEVDRHWGRSGDVDQARWLGRRLRMQVTYGPNLELPPEPGASSPRQYGNAILSRFPIVATENHPLTNLPYAERPTEQRGALHAELDVRGTTVDVWSTHLDHQRAEQRRSQVTEILDLAAARGERPGFLLGDLNARPETAEVRLLTDEAFSDPFAGSGPAGWTFPAERPEVRIDYVLGRGVTDWQQPRVIDTLASDHLPVAVTAGVPRPVRR